MPRAELKVALTQVIILFASGVRVRLVHGIIFYSRQGWAQLMDSENIVSL
jgi:hypothetical protein